MRLLKDHEVAGAPGPTVAPPLRRRRVGFGIRHVAASGMSGAGAPRHAGYFMKWTYRILDSKELVAHGSCVDVRFAFGGDNLYRECGVIVPGMSGLYPANSV
jgi:hypothetical protein